MDLQRLFALATGLHGPDFKLLGSMDWGALHTPLFELGGVKVNAVHLFGAVGVVAVAGAMAWLVRRLLMRVLGNDPPAQHQRKLLSRIVLFAFVLFGMVTAADMLGLRPGQPFVHVGSAKLSILSVVSFALVVVVVHLLASIVSGLIQQRLLPAADVDEGIRYAAGRIIYYSMLVVGWGMALQTAGVQLASLTVVLGALSVGIGFGLQNIVNNFVSGLILLIERPLKVGDWIDVSGTNGQVTNIGARSTTVVTRDNLTIIVPNADFISNQLTNWSYGDPRVRLRFPLGVAYGSDMELVVKTLMQIADENQEVLADPAPRVLFCDFGDSSLNLELAVWVDVRRTVPRFIQSDLYFAIDSAFRKARIELPFQQTDIHFRNPLPTA